MDVLTEHSSDSGGMRVRTTPAFEARFRSVTGVSSADMVTGLTGIDPRVGTVEITSVSPIFNLYSSRRGVDALVGTRRYLFYPVSPASQQAYELLSKSPVPHYREVLTIDDRFAVSETPLETRPLSQIPLTEIAPTNKTELGAIEILGEIGRLLATIKVATNRLPAEATLDDFAFIPKQARDFIRLIPPYTLTEALDIEDLVAMIDFGLKSQSEKPDTLPQLKALRDAYQRTLRAN